MSVPIDITDDTLASSLVPVQCASLAPPALLEGEKKEERKREKFYIYLDVTHTHTHPAGAGSTLKGKREKKADTDNGQKAKTAQGGEGNERTSRTNLRGETDLTETEHTPKPHNTLRRGTGGKELLGGPGAVIST